MKMSIMLDYMLVFFNLLTLACSAGIIINGDQTVSLGQDATFSCKLPLATGVKQVIWQQLSEDDNSVQKMVTFSEQLKPEVAEPYVDKVTVTEVSLDATTIVIRNVTFADETCYVCTFSAYPSGTEWKKACLVVQGITTMTSDVQVSHDPSEVALSCSATGKPTPAISWKSNEKDLWHYPVSNSTEDNSNGTITSTSTIRLPLWQFQKKHVSCVSQSGVTERTEIIYVDPSDQHIILDNGTKSRHYVVPIVVIICLLVAICMAILFYNRRPKQWKVRTDTV